MSYEGYEYPDDEQLRRVTEWQPEWINNGKTPLYGPWFDYIKSLWWMPDWGWEFYDGWDENDPVRIFHVSTGGWSGNEDLIDAMSENFICWSQTFKVHRTGGHYQFWIPDPSRRRRKPRQSSDAVARSGGSSTDQPPRV